MASVMRGTRMGRGALRWITARRMAGGRAGRCAGWGIPAMRCWRRGPVGLAPGERVTGRGPVADGVRRMAVARLAAGGVTSRQVAAEVGVEASVAGNRVASTAARAGTGGRSGDTRQAGEGE